MSDISKLQEIYNTVYHGLKNQGFKPSNQVRPDPTQGEFCVYRNPEGLRCAAGHLIPDEDYTSEMEGNRITDLDYFTNKYDMDEMILIALLQEIHDGSRSPVNMKNALLNVPEYYQQSSPNGFELESIND